MKAIQVYLTFDGNCKAAMSFYQSCLGGRLDLMTVGESPMASQWPADSQDLVLHAYLESDGLVLMGSDVSDKTGRLHGDTVTPVIVNSDEAGIRLMYDQLAAGGEATQPLHPFFAGLMGVLTDQFGIRWMFNCPKEFI